EAFPCSGEINSTVDDPAAKIKQVEENFSNSNVDYLDGVSADFDNWRYNLRMSNTEPIIRLNVESKGDEKLLQKKTKELLKIIRN
ncbi:MAG: phosphomannomutase, partial [Ignavibacteriaceae bacterium]